MTEPSATRGPPDPQPRVERRPGARARPPAEVAGGHPVQEAVDDAARVGGTRAEHRTSATERPRAAVRNLLAGRTVAGSRPVPCFRSGQYGARLRFAGRRQEGDTVRITEVSVTDGAPAEEGFPAPYERDGRTTAVLPVDRPRPFVRARRELARAAVPAQPAAR